MSERDTFGPRLRAERERRGISIDTIASVTKVGGDLWEGLERNDFSRWPSGIFARAIGLDADEAVNEFCRLFPIGDRRSSRLIQAQAQLLGHHLAYDEAGGLPVDGDRRANGRDSDEVLRVRLRIAARTLSTAIDAATSLTLAGAISFVGGISFWAVAGMITLMYYTGMTIAFGTSPGARAVEVLQQRVPTLFELVSGRRAHA
jgi:transcriptional regulator with XRE-family HTH domain